MKKTSFNEWTIQNKHSLRELYGEFLEESGISLEAFISGSAPSFDAFQAAVWENVD